MRKSKPDTKYFVKSVENEVLSVKINKNRQKMCKLFTVWFPKGSDDVRKCSTFSQNFEIFFYFSKKIENREFENKF